MGRKGLYRLLRDRPRRSALSTDDERRIARETVADMDADAELDVVRGDAKGVRLLCANRSAIDTAQDWTLNLNLKQAATSAVTL
jgi:hypothetical protein